MEDNPMPTVTLEEAQTKLPELIDKLVPGEEVVITRNEQPVAELIRLPAEKPHPVPGRCKGMLTILSEDDEYLKDWAEYMP
jgi:antitoxin (DNA-binding transcriptional repressor) of toxin-antitoxin stability system